MTIYKKSVYCKDCEDCNRKSVLFSLLNPEETKILNEDRFEVQFKAGENIAKQGTILTHLINLTSGLVKIYIEGINDRNLLLNLHGPHSILGRARNFYRPSSSLFGNCFGTMQCMLY